MEIATDFHRKLIHLAGDFVGVETHYPIAGFPDRTHANAKVSGRFDLNDLVLVREYESTRGSEILYKGLGIYSWDDQRKTYVVYWFDTAGTPPIGPAYGTWSDDILEFRYQRDTRAFRLLYHFTGADRYHFSIDEFGAGSDWEPAISGDYTRVSGPA